MRLRGIVLGMLVGIAFYLALWPVPVDPVAWNAPAGAGFTGPFARNERLRGLELLPLGGDHGPETVVVDRKGQVYTGTKEGRIFRDGRAWVSTRGRPLGMAFDHDGHLLVADALRGLLEVTPEGRVTPLVRDVAYANSVAVSPAGDVYFTDSSAKFIPRVWNGSYEASLLDILEHGGHGRVLVYDPLTKEIRTLIAGLNFPNGVAVSPDGAFVLIAETGSYRVLRHWLEGPKRGRTEPLIENLPGFPDNLTAGLDGRFWIGLVSPRNRLLDRLSRWPRLRKAVQRLPKLIRPKAVAYGHIVAIDGNGRVLASLQDPDGRYRLATGAAETEEFLYVSSLEMPAIGRMRAPVLSRVKRVPIEFRDRWRELVRTAWTAASADPCEWRRRSA
ncbi:MAG TPA: SMP-30/gluconolactonase/LRE family protein [Thermoanaerobaculia bacterium]